MFLIKQFRICKICKKLQDLTNYRYNNKYNYRCITCNIKPNYTYIYFDEKLKGYKVAGK